MPFDRLTWIAARHRRGLTQKGLAREIGVHPITVANIERGAHEPSLDTLLAAAPVLKLTLTKLTRSETPRQETQP